MKSIIIAGVLGIALIAANFPIDTWIVNTEGMVIQWQMPDENERGNFTKLDAEINFDQDDIPNSSIKAIVDAGSISTGNEKLDAHLKSADFFNVEKYPTITFTSTGISTGDGGFVVQGQLKVKDAVADVEIPFQFVQNGDNGVFQGEFKTHTKKLGIDYGGIKSKDGNGAPNVTISLDIPVMKK